MLSLIFIFQKKEKKEKNLKKLKVFWKMKNGHL